MSTSSIAGVPCWIDLLSSDVEASRAFYSGLFGWTAAEGSEEFGGYFMFMRGDQPVAGGMPQRPGEDAPQRWTVYLASTDARKTFADAISAGGTELDAPMDIADLGTQAIVTDLAGARIGIWQANTFPGIVNSREAGAPTWFELHCLDYDANVAFYSDVFGWDAHTMSDTPEFRYTTLGNDESTPAGIMDASSYADDAFASEWAVYIQVEDTDASIAKAISLGGSQVQASRDSPYGRLAEIADSTGARIKLMGPNTES